MRSIRDVLIHLLEAESGWIGYVLQGSPRRHFNPASFADLDAILSSWTTQRNGTVTWIDRMTATERLARRPLPWNRAETASVEEIVWHVVAHEQYHRGQIFTRLAMLGRRDLPDYDLLRQLPVKEV